jgi:hypothetical protein
LDARAPVGAPAYWRIHDDSLIQRWIVTGINKDAAARDEDVLAAYALCTKKTP